MKQTNNNNEAKNNRNVSVNNQLRVHLLKFFHFEVEEITKEGGGGGKVQ